MKLEKSHFQRVLILLSLVLTPFDLLGAESAFKLYFRPTGTTLNYLTTYHAETADILNVLQESGESQSLKNKTYEIIEAQKDLTRKSQGGETGADPNEALQANTLETRVKTYFLKKVNRNHAAKSIQPVEKTIMYSSIGRLMHPFNMDDLVYFGLPLFFPSHPLDNKSTWKNKFDFQASELPPMTMEMNYKFIRTLGLPMQMLAEIEYTFYSSLQTNQITDDPETRSKIEALQKNNIEMVSFEGKGLVAFDIKRGVVTTHVITMDKRMRKVTLKNQERILQDILTNYQFSEALTN